MSRRLTAVVLAVLAVGAMVAPAVATADVSRAENPAAVTGSGAPADHGGGGTHVSIAEIQRPEGTDGASPYDGETVSTTGVVTAVRDDGAGYFIQNGTGEYAGVYVYTGGSVDVSVGDRVRVTAPVTEYYGLTELDVSGEGSAEVLGSAEVPEPTVVESGAAASEAYEGVLVAVEDAEVTATPNADGVWSLDDGSGEMAVAGATAGAETTPSFAGETFSRVVGPVTYSFGSFKIVPTTATSAFDGTTLSVLAYTDIGSEASGDGTMGRFISLIEQRRAAASGPTVVVGNGDETSPHALRGQVEPGWEPPIRALNIIDPAAEAVQNHELDYDEAAETGATFPTFEAFVEASEFPWLNANVKKDGEGLPGTQDNVVVERGDTTVGIFSVADSAIDGKAGNVLTQNDWTVQDYAAVAREEAAQLRNESGADVVIGLTPIGNSLVRELARTTENVDVLVTGDRDSSFAPETVGGTVVTHPPGGASGIAEITLQIADGEIVGSSGAIRETTEDLTRNAEWADYIDDVRAKFGLDEVVATTEVPLSTKPDEYTQETALGNAIATGVKEYTDADVGITNSGGIRGFATFFPRVTTSNIRSTLSFGNDVVTLEVTGAQLRAILASQIAVHQVPYGPSHAIQVSGVTMEWVPHNATEIPFEDEGFGRVEDVYVNGEPLDPDATYTVATNRYIAEGGSGFPMNSSLWIERYDTTMAQAVISWLESVGTVTPEQVDPAVQGRLRMVDRDVAPTSVETGDGTVTVTAEAPAQLVNVTEDFTLRSAGPGRVEAEAVSYDEASGELTVTFDRVAWQQVVQLEAGGDIYGEYYDSEYTPTIRNRTDFEYAVLNIDVGALEGRPGALPGYSVAPVDPDGDGLYEDIDGDGTVTVAEMLYLVEVDESRLTEAQLEALDATGDGQLTFADVVATAIDERDDGQGAA